MTNEEARDELIQLADHFNIYGVVREALDMAIEALSNTPNTLEALDCVEKEYAIKVIQEMKHPLAMVTVKAIQKIRNSNTCENTCDFKRMSHAKDTIYRQDAIDALDRRFDDVPMELTIEILQLRRDLRERIPSAQPEIIRCKDCCHYPSEYADCPMIGWARNENDFCSRAEVKG